MTSADLIVAEYERQKALSLAKNAAYGDSALHPLGIFHKGGATDGIRARLDDKLARIQRGDEAAFEENPRDDIIGYLVLLNIAEQLAEEEADESQIAEMCKRALIRGETTDG